MSANQTTPQTTNQTPVKLPPFPLPASLHDEFNFQWEVNGELKTYTPSRWGVLTYCIPRVHVSVTEDFMKTTLREFFDDQGVLGLNMNRVQRVEFVPLKGTDDFQKAFVYHYAMTPEDRCDTPNGVPSSRWSNRFYKHTMNLVNRITSDIFASEAAKRPTKVHFKHNGRKNFWMLLPNLSPLTPMDVEITERLTEMSGDLIDLLHSFARTNTPLPATFDATVLEDKRIDTAWIPLNRTTDCLSGKERKLRQELTSLRTYAERNNVPLLTDDEAMEMIENELDEEDAAIEQMHKDRLQMNSAYGYN
jgi:hypothetical protein